MTKKHKNISLITISIMTVLVVISGIFILWFCNTNTTWHTNKKLSPVIMIPGSSATKERFNKTTKIINNETNNTHSLIKIEMKKNGKMVKTGKLLPHDNEPFIVIGFQNNHDGYKNIKQQTKLFDKAFNYLQDKYKFSTFKAYGHSNGGLVWTRWLELYYPNYDNRTRIKRLLTVGTPFNFEENSIDHETVMLHDMIKYRDKLPAKLNVISIGGTSSYETDGIVREGSYRCAKYIFQKSVKKFTMITITGHKSKHSDLPQNPQIINIMEQNLLDDQSAKMYSVKQNTASENEN